MRGWLAVAAINGLLAVAMDAVAAHSLRDRLTPHAVELIQTGARYEMYHALALIGVAWLATVRTSWPVAAAGWLFVAGIAFFSGGLFALAITGSPVFATLAPVGGTCFLLGWAALLASAFRR